MANTRTTRRTPRSSNPGTIPAPTGWMARLRQSVSDLGQTYIKADTARFIAGFALLAVSIFMLLAFTSNFFTGIEDQSGVASGDLRHAANYGGKLGAYTANYFMDNCFGIFSYFIPLFMLLLSMKLMGAYHVRLWKWFLNFSLLMIWGSLTLSLCTEWLPISLLNKFSFRLGGGHGDFIRDQFTELLGTAGAWMLVAACAVFYLIYLSRETKEIVRRMLHPQDYIKEQLERRKAAAEAKAAEKAAREAERLAALATQQQDEEDNADEEPYDEDEESGYDDSQQPDEPATSHTLELDPSLTDTDDQPAEGEVEIKIVETEADDKAKGRTVEEVAEMEPYDPRLDLEHYKYPTLELLKHYEDDGPAVNMTEQNANKDRIINVLRNFGVEITSIKATIGPTITLYEVTPAPGVRINKIRNLEDDIALSLSALGIRIIAPIPGKGTIGIEVPNQTPRIVSMESIINTRKFQESTFELPIALGKTITNEVFMVDLAKMPHLLVAGATGQGKSVGLNAIITSLLYKKHPAELKFVMVDPKKVEFSIYTPIEKHFLAMIPDGDDPIITDVTKVVQTLKSLCQLMDHRYDLLKKAKVRNIKEYNAKFKSRQLNPENGHEFMPYIVVIIDEFGDLIMTAGKEVELPIARIAQLARAVGMHMVIATQRPTTNIITGTIKANFPARMAFKVMSQIDSRTILDRPGANQLVGKGDMLFLSGNDPVRVQCAFVDTPEVERINDYICHQQGYISAFELPEPEMEGDEGGSGGDRLDVNDIDPMFEEAARLVVVHQQGSTSLIQRKFSIGYNRAGRLMDQLERAGIVGPVRGSKPREVLCADETDLDMRLQTLRQ